MAKRTPNKGGVKVKKVSTSATRDSKKVAQGKKPSLGQSFDELNSRHKLLAVVFGLQAIGLALLAKAHAVAITAAYGANNSLSSTQPAPVTALRNLFEVNLVHLLLAIVVIAAVYHALVASRFRGQYEVGLKTTINKARWIEFGLTGGLMMVTLAIVSGVQDFASLVMIFVLVEISALASLQVERAGKDKTATHHMVTGKASALPWLVIALYLVTNWFYSSAHLPIFVYWLVGSMFILHILHVINTFRQLEKVGRWADYIFAERLYLAINFVAITALVWQIYAGLLK